MKTEKITRSYKLKPYPNFSKLEEVRYSASRYSIFLQHFTTQLFYNSHIRFYSTKYMGTLANKAQKEAMGIVSGVKQASKATGNKLSCPQLYLESVPCTISPNNDSSFDYWVTVPSQFNNKVRVPVNSHKALNSSLKQGWGVIQAL